MAQHTSWNCFSLKWNRPKVRNCLMYSFCQCLHLTLIFYFFVIANNLKCLINELWFLLYEFSHGRCTNVSVWIDLDKEKLDLIFLSTINFSGRSIGRAVTVHRKASFRSKIYMISRLEYILMSGQYNWLIAEHWCSEQLQWKANKIKEIQIKKKLNS